MKAKLKTLFWGLLVPLAVLAKGGLFPYMITVIVMSEFYMDVLEREDNTTRLLVYQAVIIVLLVLVISGVLLLGGTIAILS
ncbi:hypothetical protein [Sulfurospirillum multivorans]|uniref:Membrane protein n=2 Tax=Sulfurospirillum multivorans TaxID=66821 RepID=A0AA86ANN4_SULMK|nr:hypothetical protein [Sulfurospirillum multivorans]AHJ13082.1 putative membrane protein [Sulfurospirillum multivorans DSM 12446]QEH06570.1 putative membrane protein [Sulfurospirillum multivorans]